MTVPVNRTTIATMIKAFAEGTLVDTLAHVIAAVRRESDEKIATLQARIAELEGRGFTEYKGTFTEGPPTVGDASSPITAACGWRSTTRARGRPAPTGR